MAKKVQVKYKVDSPWEEVEVANIYTPEKNHYIRLGANEKVPYAYMKLADGRVYDKVNETYCSDPDQEFFKIHIGCGSNIMQGFVNIDRIDSADLKLDLEEAKLPFPDNSVTEVVANHVMEHINNFLPLMNEIHRVLAPNGELKIAVPVYPYVECFQDPTHVRFFTDRTFNYFHEGDFLCEHVGKSYGIKPFSHFIQRMVNHEAHVTFRK